MIYNKIEQKSINSMRECMENYLIVCAGIQLHRCYLNSEKHYL